VQKLDPLPLALLLLLLLLFCTAQPGVALHCASLPAGMLLQVL
jgi:hypothetical protein